MKLVLAISGGVDSVVLLDALANEQLAKIAQTSSTNTITLAYFNHGTPHGQKAELFVKKLAKKYELPLELGRTKQKLTSEAEFRKARYKFLNNLKKKLKADWIVTAHHADDQVETVLLNLIRGSGLAGLSGMNEYTNSIWRPLIHTSKAELEQYAKQHKLKFITDPSNKNPKYARNRLRAKVLPELEQINPRAREALLRASEQAQVTHKFLKLTAQKWLKTNAKSKALLLQKFTKLPSALAIAILREIYLVEIGHLQKLEEKHFAEILKLAGNPAGNKQKKLGQLVFQTGKRSGARVLIWSN